MKRNIEHIFGDLGRAAVLGGVCALVSCGSEPSSSSLGAAEGGQVIAMSEGEGTLALEKKFLMSKDDMKLTKEGLLAGGGKRSQFEGKKQVQFGGEWAGKSYQKQQYGKQTSDWNSKMAKVENYSGGEDGSRFQTQSRLESQNARQSGQQSRLTNADARTSNYNVGAARETGTGGVSKPSDAKTDIRRRVYPQPRVINRADYEAQTIEQTRSLLGRDD